MACYDRNRDRKSAEGCTGRQRAVRFGVELRGHRAGLAQFELALAGLLPLVVSVRLWLTRAPFTARLVPEGVKLMPAGSLFRYEQIRAVWPVNERQRQRSGGRTFAIRVQHDDRELEIPARLNMASSELFDFLAGQVHVATSVPRNSGVADYFHRQLATFGAEHVWSFGARTRAVPMTDRRRFRNTYMMLALALVGILWIIAGAILHADVWAGVGGILLFCGLFGALLFFLAAKNRGPRIKNWQNASLVISPLGFALAQGDLCGELRWKEIRDVRLNLGRGVLVRVNGAAILVADLYDAPIQVIHGRIEELWRHGE